VSFKFGGVNKHTICLFVYFIYCFVFFFFLWLALFPGSLQVVCPFGVIAQI
jgi:hypothetical protein